MQTTSLAISNGVVISQVYGGGGNSGAPLKNDFIELFNRGTSTVNLSGWSVQYSSSTGSSWQVALLSGSIAPGHYYLIQEAAGTGGTTDLPTPDAIGNIAMSGSAGKIALVNQSTALSGSCPSGPNIIDLVGYGTTANCFEGTGPTPAPGNTTSVQRGSGGCVDSDNNSLDFTTGGPIPRNSASAVQMCVGPSNPSAITKANPPSVVAGGSSLLTVIVTPGANPASTRISVTGNLLSINGAAAQAFFDDGTHGDLVSGDMVYSFLAGIPASTSSGAKSLNIYISDAQARTASAVLSLVVESPLIPIHNIQGPGSRSPHVGELVTTRGIVTALRSNGFFLQTPDAEIDNDPNTSEGIFVFTSGAPPAAALPGNSVIVTGTVLEFVPDSDPHSPPVTEIAGSPTVSLVTSGNVLPAPITLTSEDTSPTGSVEQLERYEGMRVHIPSLTVISPTQGTIDETHHTSSSTGVYYGVMTGIARPMREPGIDLNDPLPSGASSFIPRFDGNPERLRVESGAQPAASILEVASGAVVSDLTGPLDFVSRTYTILPDPSSALQAPANPSASPLPAPASTEFTVASFNMKRFYDSQDDPDIEEPVLTPAALAARQNKVSLMIRNILQAPDILGVQEIENLETLQSIADQINGDTVKAGGANPEYRACLIEGHDSEGLDIGVLIKSPRVAVSDVIQQGRDATYINPLTNASELLHDRPPLLLRASVRSPQGTNFPITVIINHLRSLSGIDDVVDGPRIRAKRRAQANFLATLIQGLQVMNPEEKIVALGDFNSFPFNDGYVDVMGTIQGTPSPANEVLLPSDDLVNPDLINLIEYLRPNERYSYVFNGNAQALDHILVTRNLFPRMSQFHIAHSNADYPESYGNDPSRPERVSDHDIPVAYFTFPAKTVDLSVTFAALPTSVVIGSNISYQIRVSNLSSTIATQVTVTDTIPSQTTFVSCGATNGGVCSGSERLWKVTFPSLPGGSSATIDFVVSVSCSIPGNEILANTVTVSSVETDPNPENNTATAITKTYDPPPTVVCPDAFYAAIEPTGRGNMVVHYPLPLATDNCPIQILTSPPSGSLFPIGTTLVQVTAVDSSNQRASCDFPVVVFPNAIFFGHFVTGSRYVSTITLLNPSPSRTLSGQLQFADDQGRPLSVRLKTKSSTDHDSLSLPPLGSASWTIDGSGPLTSGSIKVTASGAVHGMLEMTIPEIGMAVVDQSAPMSAFVVSVKRDVEKGLNTSLAVYNPTSAVIQGSFSLRHQDGVEIPGAWAKVELQPGHRLSKFIHELFPKVNTRNFQGSLVFASGFTQTQIESTASKNAGVVATALEMDSRTGYVHVLPLVDPDSPLTTNQLIFPHFVVVPHAHSFLLLINPGEQTLKGEMEFFDDQGHSMEVSMNGRAPVPAISYSLSPHGEESLDANAGKKMISGSARVRANGPIGGMLRLDIPDMGTLNLEASPLFSKVVTPVIQSKAKDLVTSIAILAPDAPAVFGLTLRDTNGRPIPRGQTRLSLPVNGRISRFIQELFPQADLKEFRGVLTIEAEVGKIAVNAIKSGRGTDGLTNLPAVPMW
jgi:uncharacterized repeat protein (TIGR01451 family)